MNGMDKPARKVAGLDRWLPAGMAVLALVSAVQLVRLGVADRVSMTPSMVINAWENYDALPEEENWEREWMKVAFSLRWAPDSPLHHETMASLYMMRTSGPLAEDIDPKAYARKAAEHYRSSLRLRPASAHTWANLALAKHRAGEPDREFVEALHSAARMGAYEPTIGLMFAEAALSNWSRVPPDVRAPVARTIDYVWTEKKVETVTEARAAGERSVWCTDTGNSVLVRLCTAVKAREREELERAAKAGELKPVRDGEAGT